MKPVIRQFPKSGVKSREVIQGDVMRIIKTAKIMKYLLDKPIGLYKNGHALAHIQVVDKDPLRFFVKHDGSIIINPKIKRHTRHTVDVEEGCMSYCTKKPIKIERYYKCDVEYQKIDIESTPSGNGPSYQLSKPITKTVKGIEAQVFQHEIEHFEGGNIYNEK